MIYVHYCKTCRRLYLLAGHPMECPKCGFPVDELKIGYSAYLSLPPQKREDLRVRLENDLYLESQKRSYRFARRTERYQRTSDRPVSQAEDPMADRAEAKTGQPVP